MWNYVLYISYIKFDFASNTSNYTNFITSNDNNGLELNRQTITAQYDSLFKALLEQHANKSLTDDEYFPTHAKLHIDRGAVMLKNRYNYSSNMEHFITQMIQGDISI